MAEYRFYHPVEVRYADLDPQGHVNNAKHFTYIEQARVAYIQHLGLWEGTSFHDIGMILAEARVAFLSAIRLNQKVRVGARVTRLGEKSFDMDYRLEDAATHKELAHGTAVIVAYDYGERQSMKIPEVWRHAICTFEDIPSSAGKEND
jgi:acyl-CoA thioester hydrolase